MTSLRSDKFGISDIDNLNTRLKLKSIRRVFREAGKFEKAHKKFGLHLWYELNFDKALAAENLVKEYKAMPQFDVVEARQPYSRIEPVQEESHTQSSITSPVNDPLFSQQWHFMVIIGVFYDA